MTQRIAPDEEDEDDEVEIYVDGHKITTISITLWDEEKTLEAPFTETDASIVRGHTRGTLHDTEIK